MKRNPFPFLLTFGMLLTPMLLGGAADAATAKYGPRYMVEISGSGARVGSVVEMTTGGSSSLKATVDQNGRFLFPSISYQPELPLNLGVMASVFNRQFPQLQTNNVLTIAYNPFLGTAEVKGSVTPSALVVGNMTAEDSSTSMASDDGRVTLNLTSQRGINDRASKLVLSVVNVASTCCPRVYIPHDALTLSFKTVQPPGVQNDEDRPLPAASPTTTAPAVTKPKKSVIPEWLFWYKRSDVNRSSNDGSVVLSQSSYQMETNTGLLSYGVSVPQDKMEKDWLTPVRLWANDVFEVIKSNNGISQPSLNDAMAQNESLSSVTAESVRPLLEAQSTDQVCRAGSMSRSLAKANFSAIGQQRALATILQERDLGKAGSLHYDDGLENINITSGTVARVEQFRGLFCDKKGENNSLSAMCNVSIDTSINRDIDYARFVDAPLTLDIDFLNDQVVTEDEAGAIAMAENLFPTHPLIKDNTVSSSVEKYMDLRSLLTARNIARNSFAAIISEKSKVIGATASNFAGSLLRVMGVSSDEMTKFLGDHPSYYAQMEVVGKLIYQNPSFAQGLMGSEVSVDRARVAMKAVDLQQNADLLNSMYRREMLLSTYLEQMIQESATRSSFNQR